MSVLMRSLIMPSKLAAASWIDLFHEVKIIAEKKIL